MPRKMRVKIQRPHTDTALDLIGDAALWPRVQRWLRWVTANSPLPSGDTGSFLEWPGNEEIPALGRPLLWAVAGDWLRKQPKAEAVAWWQARTVDGYLAMLLITH